MVDWPVQVVKAWVCREVLLRLEFAPESIRVAAVPAKLGGGGDRDVTAACVEVSRVGKVARLYVGVWPGEPAQFDAAWTQFTSAAAGDPGFEPLTKAERSRFIVEHGMEFEPGRLLPYLASCGVESPLVARNAAAAAKRWRHGGRASSKVLQEHMEALAPAVQRMVEDHADPREYMCIVAEQEFRCWGDVCRLFGAKRGENKLLVGVVVRADAMAALAACADVSEEFLRAADGVGALPVVICAEEGHDFAVVDASSAARPHGGEN